MRTLCTVLLFLLTSCVVAPSSSNTYEYYNYYWSAECQPLVLVIDDSFDAQATLDVAMAAEYWNSILGRKVFVLFFTTYRSPNVLQSPHLHSRICGLVYVRNQAPVDQAYPDNSFAGYTTLLPDSPVSNKLHVGVVQISPDPLDTPYRMFTVAHELGHVLGLDHRNDSSQDLMSYSLTDTELIISTDELDQVNSFLKTTHDIRN